MKNSKIGALAACAAGLAVLAGTPAALAQGEWVYRDQYGNEVQRGTVHSVAREWNEVLLEGIRHDFARPTVHARNLYHISAAMWDAWAAFDANADQIFHHERMTAKDVHAAREEAVSFAAMRMIQYRFANSPGAAATLAACNTLMVNLGFDPNNTSVIGNTPSALGNRIAATIIDFGHTDGSNEQNGYANQVYQPVNPALLVPFPGNPDLIYPNRWQPLALDFYVDQGGNIIPDGYPPFLSPEWGQVVPFSLREEDKVIYNRDGLAYDWTFYHDPGAPPYYNGVGDDYYRWGFELVAKWSGQLDPTDGVEWDVSPNTIGNAPLAGFDEWADFYDLENGGDWSQGYDVNPVTGQPYEVQTVPRGDYARILAEFWADGPASETPPGHWFTILNYVNDHPLFQKRLGGTGPVVEDLEWDVKAYLAMGGAMHDVAVAVWGAKGYYDFIRPVSAIRYMADQGQRTDPGQPSYNPDGIDLIPGHIEVVTAATTAPGQRHEHLLGNEGKIALLAWRGPNFIIDPETDDAGAGWILAENWWPYQRPSFVSPPFAGYVSGHSTYSRAAARLMSMLTGSEYFPGGLGEFFCPQNDFLVFEEGPSVDVTLQWAKYMDASDQCSLSRIWGGIHPPCDDLPGRHMGQIIGPEAFEHALALFDGRVSCPADLALPHGQLDFFDLLAFLNAFVGQEAPADLASPYGQFDFFDIQEFLNIYSNGCP